MCQSVTVKRFNDCVGSTSTDEVDELDESPPNQRSELAQQIDELTQTVDKLLSERERLPQPLFWSLFNAKLTDLKKTKELKRIVQENLG